MGGLPTSRLWGFDKILIEEEKQRGGSSRSLRAPFFDYFQCFLHASLAVSCRQFPVDSSGRSFPMGVQWEVFPTASSSSRCDLSALVGTFWFADALDIICPYHIYLVYVILDLVL